jgi:hypothetical protein
MLTYRKILITLVFFIFLPVLKINGQVTFVRKIFDVAYDTNYISTYITDYTTRFFGSVKYGQTSYNDNLLGKSLYYKPNNKLLLGIGVNHGSFGLNIGINFPAINQDDEKYGETKYYDFTIRVFSPRFNSTIYLQHYKGFYLRNTKDMIPGWEHGDPYYIRGDIRTITAGIDISYIFNNSKFSYRAAIIQNEWQKKSSGSFLLGGGLIYNATIGDSSIVPTYLYYENFFDGLKFDRSNNFSIGPTIGYAYTFVYKKHYFILGALNGSGNLGFTRFLLVDNEEKIKSGAVFGLRAELLLATGYNSDRWYFGIAYFDMSMTNQAPLQDRTINYDTGMFRFNVVRRFATKKPIKFLNPGYKGIE